MRLYSAPAALLSVSLLLAACGQPTVPATTSAASTTVVTSSVSALSAQASAPGVTLRSQGMSTPTLALTLPAGVEFVTVELTGGKLEAPRVYTARVQGGSVRLSLSGLPKGDPKYTLTIRAYDKEGGAVLYRSQAEVNFASGKVSGSLVPQRLNETVTVVASPVLAKTNTLVAKLGDLTQTMNVEGGQATARFENIPTASGLTVTVTGTAADGQLTQTGSATFTLSEGGATVNVPLTEVASCPVSATPVTAIPAVQGSGAASPLVGQTVTVRGVVTADFQSGLRGFFVQDRAGDGDAATSDGVFVFTGSAPQTVQPGDLVQLSGTVKEFFGTTQIDTVTAFAACASGLKVEPVTVGAPFTDLERYEGMVITIPETLTVTDNFGLGRYGELGLSAGGRLFNPTNGNVQTTLEQNNARRIVLDDANTAQNPAQLPYLSAEGTRRTGDTVSGLTGVLHYANNAFKVEPTVAPTFVNANPRPAQPKDVGGSLKVAGANVLNYFTTFGPSDRGANSAYEFARQKAKVIASLKGLDADVVTLMEVQNNGDAALSDLVTSLNAAYGTDTYAAVQTGTIGTDAIKVAIIYKPARVTPIGGFVIDPDPIHSRPPLAQTFQDKGTGGVFTVVANHFKSKGSCPNTGDVDRGEGCWNELRVQQSQRLLTFVDTLKARSGDQDVLLMGDFNAYGAEAPIRTLTSGGFVSENLRIPAEERYSYQFGGQFGYLDHALASSSLDTQVTGVTEWHINADEPTLIDYNVEFKQNPECRTSTCTSPDLYQPTPYRASDHDPVLIGLNLNRDEVREVLSVSVSGPDTVQAGAPYTLSLTPSQAPETLTVNWGDGSTETLSAAATSATHTYANAGAFTVTVTATRQGQQAQATKALSVTAAPGTGGGSGKLVISQIYGGGGNAGATYTNDFIEIFNAGGAAVNLGSYSVQYASATGTSWAVTPLTSVNLAPGQYYLVQQAKGTGGTTPLPTPDASGNIAMAGGAGQVVLAETTARVGSKDDASVRDYVAYSGLGNTTAAVRAGSGCTDTDSAADFTATAPSPRNTSTALNVCTAP
ncbi:hypothetical protein SAMN04488058_107142 [Deinococcus reticulitermitis]|uniref:LTD domain-containing protein n=1 Tax=Deinococcus reticulitermitis TaxID=856736 RepID=A0A1H6YJL9_9DEIO|nr:ExeM/NucH family extracellular endonuclease [Deinococcus reticulitermitis]SEJ41481.1 hypothetical protein SAMN04488058_107142 [Deinococcus reticulitermitis]